MSFEGNAPVTQEPVEQQQPQQDRRAALLEGLTNVENGGDASAGNQPSDGTPEFGRPAGRARDESGKFVPKQAAPAVDQTQPIEQEPWRAPPKSWKPDLRDGWGKLDPTYQQYVHEREQEMRAGVEPLLPKAEFADQIQQAAAPYMNTVMGLGLTLPQAVSGLMEVDHNLRTLPFEQKVALLYQTALAYGIDLSGQMPNIQQSLPPQYQQTQNEVLQIKGQIQNYIQQQEAMQTQSALEEIQSFSQTAEFFEEAKPMMIRLLQGRFATGIKEAYDQAIRLTPELFERVQSGRQAATDAEKRKAANDAAQRAKAAAVSVKTATPGYQAPANAQDRRSVLREQLDALSERL